jgi:hypothetical protein
MAAKWAAKWAQQMAAQQMVADMLLLDAAYHHYVQPGAAFDARRVMDALNAHDLRVCILEHQLADLHQLVDLRQLADLGRIADLHQLDDLRRLQGAAGLRQQHHPHDALAAHDQRLCYLEQQVPVLRQRLQQQQQPGPNPRSPPPPSGKSRPSDRGQSPREPSDRGQSPREPSDRGQSPREPSDRGQSPREPPRTPATVPTADEVLVSDPSARPACWRD